MREQLAGLLHILSDDILSDDILSDDILPDDTLSEDTVSGTATDTHVADIHSAAIHSAGMHVAGIHGAGIHSADVRVVDLIAVVESAGRLIDALRVRVLAPVITDAAVVVRLGYTSPGAAVASIARISERSARQRLKVASAVCPDVSMTGAPLPAPHPMFGDALDSGNIGLDAAMLVATELGSLRGRTSCDVLQFAETVMVRLATGIDAGGEAIVSTVSVDYLAGEIRQVTAAVDPDGTRPREERAKRRRDFRVGTADEDGLVPAYGRLLPEIGSLLLGLLEAHRRSPRFAHSTTGPVSTTNVPTPPDTATPDTATADMRTADMRTAGQRRHDHFADILTAVARSDSAPRLDGAPVSVLVTVHSTDLLDPHGIDNDPIGSMAGSLFPVSRRRIEQFIDASGYRIITFDNNGATTGISSPQRCFTNIQRLGIAARDGYRCATPGCTSAHYTLQAHHVIPDRDNGPTAINNGILLCYWHHQMVDTGPWRYRMINGTPHVRGPGIPDWTTTRTTPPHHPTWRAA